jgi:hypothetical protein
MKIHINHSCNATIDCMHASKSFLLQMLPIAKLPTRCLCDLFLLLYYSNPP